MADNSILNSYEGAFILEKTKLIRIIDVIEKSFQKTPNGSIQKSFLTKFNNGKEASLGTIDEVFNLDNGIKNKVTELKIRYEKEENKIDVHFDGDRKTPVIYIGIESDNLQWSNESFAEIEEQTERTRQTGWVYEMKGSTGKDVISYVALIVMLAMVAIVSFALPSSLEGLSERNVIKQQLLSEADTIQTYEDKINFLFNVTKEITLDGHKQQETKSNSTLKGENKSLFSNWEVYLIIVPVLIIIGILWYLIRNCYWLFGFIWGDMEEAYQKSVEQRKMLWNILFGSLILGMLSNLFVFGLTNII